jgi:hypothetical protein
VRDTGPAPECRIEISPSRQRTVDHFLNVLTAADDSVTSVEKANAQVKDKEIVVTIGKTRITFEMTDVQGRIELSGMRNRFTNKIVVESAELPGG